MNRWMEGRKERVEGKWLDGRREGRRGGGI